MGPLSRRRSWIRGMVAVVAALLALVSVAPWHLDVPDAGSLLLVAVVYASFEGGVRAGLPAAALAEAGLLGYHRWQGDYAAGPLAQTGPLGDGLAFGLCAVCTALLVGALRRRTERRLSLERDHRNRMAELERVKSHFLNVASHELRGPLSVARGYASMLADGSFGPPEATDVRAVAPVILAKLDQMNHLVDSMLDTARLEEQRLVLARERVDLREIVDGAVAAVQMLLEPHHELRWRRPREAVSVDGDAARLSIVLTNLLQNAIKYSPQGGIVEVFVAGDERRATVTVWDQGLGIADSDMPRLFSRFGRIVTPRNSHIPGTGLGLYLARELARLHGGDLVVTSAVGRGSAFTLVLPAAGADPAEEERDLPGRLTPAAPAAAAQREPAVEAAG